MSTFFEKKQTLKHEIRNMFTVLRKIYDKAPCLVAIAGKIRSGKSCACLALIKFNKQYKKFDDIIIVSSTIHSNFWTKNGISPNEQFETLTPAMLTNLKEHQLKTQKKRAVMLIIDDCIDSANMYDKNVVSFLTVLRHYNTTVVVITQSITKISPVIRSNCDFMILFQLVGEKALKTLFDEISMGESRRIFVDTFIEKTNNYSSIFIDNTTPELNQRIGTFKVNPQALGIKL